MRTSLGLACLALALAACGGSETAVTTSTAPPDTIATTAVETTLALPEPTSSPSPDDDGDAGDGAEVAIRAFAFAPAEVSVPVGATVVWVNQEEAMPHTATSDDGLWDSGTLDPGERFSFTFEEPGTYTYFCRIHPSMKGTIVVEG